MALTLNGDDGIAGVDGSAATPAIQGTDSNTGISFGTDTVNVVTGGTTRATVDSSGRVGIGITSPTVPLQVNGTGQIARFESSSSSAVVRIANTETNPCEFVYTSDLAINVGGSERVRVDSSGNLRFNSGYGSVATAYACRAWVNFNGTNTLTVRGSGNVSSVTDHGAGDYSVNFATSMPDANYSSGGWVMNGTYAFRVLYGASAAFPSTSTIRIGTANSSLAAADSDTVHFAVFR